MQNVHTGEFINGYEIGLQRMGYIGYRVDKTPVFAYFFYFIYEHL
jgi:hypothetical protein